MWLNILLDLKNDEESIHINFWKGRSSQVSKLVKRQTENRDREGHDFGKFGFNDWPNENALMRFSLAQF